MQITIELPEHLITHIQAQVTSGHYATPSDDIEALIQADQARNQYLQTQQPENSSPEIGQLLSLIGTLDLGTTDLGENHDHYIGEALYRELRNRS